MDAVISENKNDMPKGESTYMAIIFTENAAEEVKRIMAEQGLDGDVGLRVAVNGGGCSGFMYSLGFDEKFDAAADRKYECQGVSVVTDKKSALYLDGVTVDFLDQNGRKGFAFNNPNESSSCSGCGH